MSDERSCGGAEGGTCKERSDGIANAERGRLDKICQGA